MNRFAFVWITGVVLLCGISPTCGQEIEFTTKTIDEQPVLSVRFEVAEAEISQKLGQVLPRVFQYAQANGAEMAGQPFSRYHGMADGKMDMEAGMPIKKAIKGDGDIKSSSLPGGRVVTGTHVGPYHLLGQSHEAMTAWAKENGQSPIGAPWEFYITDPGAEPDSSKWKTELFLPCAAE